MNSKKNSFKRVAAGALAVLTVAAYTAPVANVGGLTNPLVANAAVGDYDVTFSWAEIADYMESLTVNGTTLKGANVTDSTNRKFTKASGSEVTIVSKVPIDMAAAFATYTLDQNTTVANYKLEAGHYNVTENKSVYTYNIILKDENNGIINLTGSKQNVAFYSYDKNITNRVAEPTEEAVNVDKITIDGTIENPAVNSDDQEIKGAVEQYIINGKVVLKSTKNFVVEVYDGATSTSTIDPDVTYNTKEKKYVAEFDMPKFKGTYEGLDNNENTFFKCYNDNDPTNKGVNMNGKVCIVVQAKDAAALTYTEKNNQLLANGLTVETNSVAAQITATQQRAKVVDPDTAAVIDEEIKSNTELAYNGTMKYGMDPATDYVELTIKRDDEITTVGGADTLYNGAYAAVTIKKDGAYYTEGLGGTNYLGVAGGKRSAQTDWREILFQKDNGTLADVKKLNADGTFKLPKFTEAGEYEVTATFFVKDANGGTNNKTINFKFTISPIEIKASDVKVSFSYKNIAEKTNANLVTPTAVSFKDGGILEITVPDSLKGTTFNAHVEIPTLDNKFRAAYETAFDAFRTASVANKYVDGKKIKDTDYVGGLFTLTFDDDSTATYNKNYIAPIPAVTSDANGNNVDQVAYKAPYSVDGALTATKFDTTNRVNLNIYDQNYGAPYSADGSEFATVNLRYKLVKEVQQPMLKLLNVHPDYVGNRLKVAVDDTDIDTFTEIFWNNFEGNEIVEDNKELISFEYLEGTGRNATDDDLDSHNEGVPTKKNDINYTLYVLFDGEVFASYDLELVSVKAKIVPADSELKLTYGDKIDIQNYKIVNSKGTTIKNIKLEEVIPTSIYVAKDGNLNKAGVQPKLDVDGKYMREDDVNQIPNNKATLDAGTYIVTFGAVLDKDVDYTVSSDEYILVVDKKQITGDMFTTDAVVYDAKQHSKAIKDFKFTFQNENEVYNHDAKIAADPYTGELVSDEDGAVAKDNGFYVSGGTTKATAASKVTYNAKTGATTIEPNVIQISADEDNKNFTGTAEVNWYISYKENEQKVVDFTWDSENTLLFDAGRIHVQYGKTNDSKIKINNPETKKPYVIEDYGVIVDKNAIIEAPDAADLDKAVGTSTVYEEQKTGTSTDVNFNAAKAKATAALQYGNGFTIGHASDDNKAASIYGANIKVEDVEKGVWVRPYALLDDGTIVYGQAIFLDITREAKKQLQFQLNPVKKLDKTNNLAGYDNETGKYTFYASYTKFDTTKVQAQVKDFGVIVDKKGSFINNGAGKFVLASDKTTTIEEYLKVGNGFTEGHFNPASEKLGANEYGAKITPKDTVTGIWVRGYIKLSDSLIIYTEPAYYNSVSDYYASKDASRYADLTPQGKNYEAKFSDGSALVAKYEKYSSVKTPELKTNYSKSIIPDGGVAIRAYVANTTTAPANDLKYENASGKFKIAFFNNIKANDSALTFVKQGVIVDKNETLVTREYSSNDKTFAYTIKPEANTKLVLGKGFVEGVKTKAANNYTASVTPVAGKAITVRPYTTFKITGTDTEITVYGDIRVVSSDSYIFQ